MNGADDAYVDGHIEEALAREGETDVHVRVAGDALVLTGTVATEVRRSVVNSIAGQHAGDRTVHDELTVLHCAEPDGEERLP